MVVRVTDCYVTDIDTKNKGYRKKLGDGSTQNRVKTKKSTTTDCKRVVTQTEEADKGSDLGVIDGTEEENKLDDNEEGRKQGEQPTMAKIMESFRRFASAEKPESKSLEKENPLQND